MKSKLQDTKAPKKDSLDNIIDKVLLAMQQFGYNDIDRAGVLKNEAMMLFFESLLEQAELNEVQIKAVMARLRMSK